MSTPAPTASVIVSTPVSGPLFDGLGESLDESLVDDPLSGDWLPEESLTSPPELRGAGSCVVPSSLDELPPDDVVSLDEPLLEELSVDEPLLEDPDDVDGSSSPRMTAGSSPIAMSGIPNVAAA
jgi:hypothetical protein